MLPHRHLVLGSDIEKGYLLQQDPTTFPVWYVLILINMQAHHLLPSCKQSLCHICSPITSSGEEVAIVLTGS